MTIWAVTRPPTPREALAKYGGAWSADSSTQIALDELVAALRIAVAENDRLQRELAAARVDRDGTAWALDRNRRELAEARAYISTIIDAPGDGK